MRPDDPGTGGQDDRSRREQIVAEALSMRETSKPAGTSWASLDSALGEIAEMRRAEERRGLERALKAARESEQRRRGKATLAAALAFLTFLATALITGGALGLISISFEVYLALLGFGAVGFAVLAFVMLR